jgi:hypothetical protein
VLFDILFQPNLPFELDGSFYGILVSAFFYFIVNGIGGKLKYG